MDIQTRLVDSRLSIEYEELSDDLGRLATEEYNAITQLHNNSIEKWLHSLTAKSGECKCGNSNVIIGEMLVHIFKKLEHLENLITGDKKQYIPLKNATYTTKLGHGVVFLDSISNVVLESNSLESSGGALDSNLDSKVSGAGVLDSNLDSKVSSGGVLDSNKTDSKLAKFIESKTALVPQRRYYARLILPIFPVRCIPLFCVASESNILQISKIGERDLKEYDGFIVSVEREMLKARRMQKHGDLD